MKCLRIYATPDGESHFGEVEIPMTAKVTVAPGATPFQVSRRYPASSMEFTQIPAGMRQVDWHTVPARVRQVSAGEFVLVEDTHTESAICPVTLQTSKPFFGSGYPTASICRPDSSQGALPPTTLKVCKWPIATLLLLHKGGRHRSEADSAEDL